MSSSSTEVPAAPRVIGLVVEIPGRRHVFLSIGRVTSIRSAGQVITTGLINVRRFSPRAGEVRVLAEMLGRRVSFADGSGTAVIEDVAIEPNRLGEWAISQLFLLPPEDQRLAVREGSDHVRRLERGRRAACTGESQSPSSSSPRTRSCTPPTSPSTLLDLPQQRMIEVAEELSDDRLAERPRGDARGRAGGNILDRLGDERAADILDQMEPDDAADLLAQLAPDRLEQLLELMEPEEAEDVRMPAAALRSRQPRVA